MDDKPFQDDTVRSDNSIKINVTWDFHMEKSF